MCPFVRSKLWLNSTCAYIFQLYDNANAKDCKPLLADRAGSVVCLSVCRFVCKLFAQIASTTNQMARLRPNLNMTVFMWRESRVCSRSRSRAHDLYILHKNHFFFQANGCILTKLNLSVTFPSLCPFRFHPLPNPQMAVNSLCEFRNSSQIRSYIRSETVCQQFVKLFAIRYGLTFCLYVR